MTDTMRTRNKFYYHVNRREVHKYLVNRNEQLQALKHKGINKHDLQFYPDYCGFFIRDAIHTKAFKWIIDYPM